MPSRTSCPSTSPRCAAGGSTWIEKTRAAVKDRLTKEITYWDHRAEQLKLQEQAGKAGARLNSQEARRRADDLQARLQKRLAELDREAQISALPPVVLGGLVVVPLGLVAAMTGRAARRPRSPADTQAAAARARAIVMEVERSLGFEPTDREFEKLGYDIESRVPGTGRLRFIEVKGRVTGADTVTVTKNEILYSPQQAGRLHPRDGRVPRRRRAPRSLPAPPLPARAGLRCDQRELRFCRPASSGRRSFLTTNVTVQAERVLA